MKQLLEFAPNADRLAIHNAFRFPAKFHPPVARELVRRYSIVGGRVLDPFCGSGTVLIEAAVAGRDAIGSDVDPLAVFISQAKSAKYDVSSLEADLESILQSVAPLRRGADEYRSLQFKDLDDNSFVTDSKETDLPAIPNLEHWFRRYVLIDLARLKQVLSEKTSSIKNEMFFNLVFAAIIRNASNADPVPVSGLEVTSHMRKKEAAGRTIDPFSLFEARAGRLIAAVKALDVARRTSRGEVRVMQHDARDPYQLPPVDSIITSPPYQSAVDYYRRHQLEMFWLKLTKTQSDRLELLPKYVGRAHTPQSHPDLKRDWQASPLARSWHAEIAAQSPERARDFHAYFSAMTTIFESVAGVVKTGCPLVMVVGRSRWGGVAIPTESLFKELAPPSVRLVDQLTYPVVNRTMSYSRHNGANIDEEHVLVFERVS